MIIWSNVSNAPSLGKQVQSYKYEKPSKEGWKRKAVCLMASSQSQGRAVRNRWRIDHEMFVRRNVVWCGGRERGKKKHGDKSRVLRLGWARGAGKVAG